MDLCIYPYPTSTTSRYAALRVCCTTPWACTCMLLRCIPGVPVVYTSTPQDLTTRDLIHLDVSRVMILLIKIPGSLDPGSVYLVIVSTHSILHPVCCTARMLYYAMGVYLHAAYCILVPCCIASRGSHTPEMSSSGYLTGHDSTHRDLMDPGSLDLPYSTSPRAAERVRGVCTSPQWAQRMPYAVLHVPCTEVTPSPMPHTYGPRCRSLGSPVWGNPRIHGSWDLI